jgi:hypothetical protein
MRAELRTMLSAEDYDSAKRTTFTAFGCLGKQGINLGCVAVFFRGGQKRCVE